MRAALHPPVPPQPMRPKPLRKIIQIAAVNQSDASYPDLFAVCDDGTAWQMLNHENTWQRLPEIPQPE